MSSINSKTKSIRNFTKKQEKQEKYKNKNLMY